VLDVSLNPWRRRTPPRSRAGGVADASKTPSLCARRRLARARLDDAGIHLGLRDTPNSQKRCIPVTTASTTSHRPLTVNPAMVMNLSNVTPG